MARKGEDGIGYKQGEREHFSTLDYQPPQHGSSRTHHAHNHVNVLGFNLDRRAETVRLFKEYRQRWPLYPIGARAIAHTLDRDLSGSVSPQPGRVEGGGLLSMAPTATSNRLCIRTLWVRENRSLKRRSWRVLAQRQPASSR